MASRPTFPGMNPYLENLGIWSEVHYGLMSVLTRTLNPQLNPKYRAAVVSVPMTTEVAERYLEVREVGSGRVITVVEVLSPKKDSGAAGIRQT